MLDKPGKSKRGFASMDPQKQKEIASKGGKIAHQKGTAHEFTSEEARGAGRKGGQAVSRNRLHMAEIGREGGHRRAQRSLEAARQSQKHEEATVTNLPQGGLVRSNTAESVLPSEHLKAAAG